jgi:hypothetical protein
LLDEEFIPMAIFPDAVVAEYAALLPIAIFSFPVVFDLNA